MRRYWFKLSRTWLMNTRSHRSLTRLVRGPICPLNDTIYCYKPSQPCLIQRYFSFFSADTDSSHAIPPYGRKHACTGGGPNLTSQTARRTTNLKQKCQRCASNAKTDGDATPTFRRLATRYTPKLSKTGYISSDRAGATAT